MDALSARGSGWRRLHRGIALVGLVTVLCFGLTGLLHPLMTRAQPKPASSQPPPAAALPTSLATPATFLLAAGIERVQGLRLVPAAAGWVWRVQGSNGPARWFDAASGAPLAADFERDQAIVLARHYAGLPAATVTTSERLAAFDADYGYVNRLLPVWRVALDTPQHLTAYLLPDEGRLATLTDDRKRAFQQLFGALHSWQWLPWPLRGWWINVLLAGLLATVLAGYALRTTSRGGRRWSLRRAHRWAAPFLALFALAWIASGFLQARGAEARERDLPATRGLDVAAADLQAALAPSRGATGATLVQLGGVPVWRWSLAAAASTAGQGLAMGEHQHAGHAPAAVAASMAVYVDAKTGAALADGEAQHVAELIRHFGGTPGEANPVTHFTPEYGFLFKRLPVWRVPQADAGHTALFIDPEHELLAARVTDHDRFVGALFAYAHKWEWVTPLAGKDWRDALAALAVFLLIATALGGALLGLRQARNARTRSTVSSPTSEP